MNRFKKYMTAVLFVYFCPFNIYAQDLKKPLIGCETAHLLDLYEGDNKLANGFTDIDLKGLDGSNTAFDIAIGLNIEVPLNQKSSIVLSLVNGRMTSQNQNQYAKMDLETAGISYRRYFKGRFFYQLGMGITAYESKRYFVRDNGLFSSILGQSRNTSTAVGHSFEFGNHLQIVTMTDFRLIFSDAVDGYDNGQNYDIMLKTGISVMYRLN
jgi:hypothetical protein